MVAAGAEVVIPGETGLLIDPNLTPGTFDPADPPTFAADLADGVNRLVADPALRRQMGKAGRRRVEERFSWDAIADRTLTLYRTLLAPQSVDRQG